MEENNTYCVYQHRRLDTDDIFYIGIGKSKKRAFIKCKYARNKYWTKIKNKTEYNIEILHENVSLDLACQIEIYLINYYGRSDLKKGKLCNMTDGGEGCNNLSKESRERINLATKIRANLPEVKARFIQLNKDRIWSNEAKEKSKQSIMRVHDLEIMNIVRSENGKKRRKEVINTQTGEIYESVKKCSESNNIPISTLTGKLCGFRKNNTNFKYITNE